MSAVLEPLRIETDFPELAMAQQSARRQDDEAKPELKPRWCNLRAFITVEPLIFLFMFAQGVHGPAVAALTYQKICLMQFSNPAICDNLKNGSFNAEEDIVQTGSSHWFLYQTLAFEVPAIIMSFFYGSLSDHFSRRLSMGLPALGQAISVANYMICAAIPNSHVSLLVVGHVISGFFGGWITCLLAVFSYLSDVTTEHNRTSRIAVAEGIISLSIALSYFLSGIILERTSYEFVFGISLTMYLLVIVYVWCWIVEPKRPGVRGHKLVEGSLRDVFSWKKTKESFLCTFRKREGKGRKRVLLLLLALFTTAISYNALYTLGYLYLKRRPLSWSQSTFGMYVGYFKGISGVAVLVLLPLMKKRLRMRDTSIILVSLVSSSLSELLFGVSTRTWMVFVVPILGMLSDAKMTGLRSMLSMFVEKDELGKMFAAVGSLQSLSGLIGSSLFNTLYPLTLTFWPGFCFSLGVLLSFIPLSIVGWLHVDLKKSPRYVALEDENPTENGHGEVYFISGNSADRAH